VAPFEAAANRRMRVREMETVVDQTALVDRGAGVQAATAA